MTSQPMSSMWMPPSEPLAWRFTDFALVYLMWAVMMAAMMLPSVYTHDSGVCPSLPSTKQSGQPIGLVYSLRPIWEYGCYSVACWRCCNGNCMDWPGCHPEGLVKPGLVWLPRYLNCRLKFYQFMPIKNACLRHCKTPMGFFIKWMAGWWGWCNLKWGWNMVPTVLGCCWAQMLNHVCRGRDEPAGNGFD